MYCFFYISRYIDEYEKSHMDYFDLNNDDVICPVCKKANLVLQHQQVSCDDCKWLINTQKTLSDIRNDLITALEKHNSTCNSTPQFTIVTDCDIHIFLICDICSDMQFIV